MKFEIVHRFDDAQVDRICAAIVTAAQTRRGLHDPPPPEPPKRPEPSDYEQLYRAKLAALAVDENRRRHLAGALAVLMGRQPVPAWTTLAEIRQDVAEAGLPLP